jgi:hypothetical protein
MDTKDIGFNYRHMALITEPEPRWGEAGPTHDPVVLANFAARPTDVLITTAPKAGTTWMQQILHQLRSGGDTTFSSIDDVVPWLELPRGSKSARQILDDFDAIRDPRVFKTHCTYEQTPGVDTASIILSSRDPRDCCVSYYHHVMDMTDAARARIGTDRHKTFDDVFEAWMSFSGWYRNVQGWWPHMHDENVLWLRYEDMKQDLPGSIDRILDFLGWGITSGQRQRAIENSSFDWMKAHADKFTRQLAMGKHTFRHGGLIRKGKTGDYRTLLSAEQERRILAKAREMLTPDCLAFLGIDR